MTRLAKSRLVAPSRLAQMLRVPEGEELDLSRMPTDITPGFRGGKTEGVAHTERLLPRLAALQERLFAGGVRGSQQSLLLVLQGMDTSGKSGTVAHVLRTASPLGVHYKSFKAPTPEERRHDFLWRIRKELPGPGVIGVFDRSHYEDVVTTRVHNIVPPSTWKRRFGTINTFEERLVESGTVVVKCFLHISLDEQRRRLLARLNDPTIRWKYSPQDLDERALWPEYMRAYSEAIMRCSTAQAPWYVVPADRKWWRNLAISELLIHALDGMNLSYPVPDFDVEREKARLA